MGGFRQSNIVQSRQKGVILACKVAYRVVYKTVFADDLDQAICIQNKK